jgi:predicted Zn-dependent peptidase
LASSGSEHQVMMNYRIEKWFDLCLEEVIESNNKESLFEHVSRWLQEENVKIYLVNNEKQTEE